ncbi:hypothetical protein ACHAXA_006134 [Cyclostephanos tholiformis]|uniref:Uncharacterized protein n=1 Tax=Cyclostephanos tholiformis TaxID=382380 RepID=A0ABD3RAP7_9STRA
MFACLKATTMGSNRSVALIMLGIAWRTTRVTCIPSFVPLHRLSAGHKHFLNRSSRLKPSRAGVHYCASGGGMGNESPEYAIGDASVQSRANFRLSGERQLCSTAKMSSFTWPDLVGLFRNTDTPNVQNVNYIPSDHPNLALFRRSVSVQRAYERHKEYLNNCWESAYDYLVVSKFGERFGFEKVVVGRGDASDGSDLVGNNKTEKRDDVPPNGQIYRANPSLMQASRYAIDNRITYLSLVPNDFPYDVDEGIEHWCLWKIGGASSTESILTRELEWALRELKMLRAHEFGGRACIIHRDGRTYGMAVDDSQMPITSERVRKPVSYLDVLYWVNPPYLQSMPEIKHAHILVLRSDEKSYCGHAAPYPPPV